MFKEIEFSYINEFAWDVHQRPFPASGNVPEWFRNMPPFAKGRLAFGSGEPNTTAKRCIPMLDGITSGYIIPLWSDVHVNTKDAIEINWKVTRPVFMSHGPAAAEMIPPPYGYNRQPFKYVSMLRVVTPKGYSIIVQHPSGYQDSIFRSIPAIIDTDFRGGIDLAFPMWVRDGVDTVVEKGTPLVQIIPFKRENWKSKFSYVSDQEFLNDQNKNAWSKIKYHYRDNIWKKKKFQ